MIKGEGHNYLISILYLTLSVIFLPLNVSRLKADDESEISNITLTNPLYTNDYIEIELHENKKKKKLISDVMIEKKKPAAISSVSDK